MRTDQRDLLEALKSEFDFLQNGSYARMAKYLWRPRFLLEDSPSCPNYCAPKRDVPCNECALMTLVPPPCQKKKIPCRFIPLDSQGQTLDSLYRTANDAETEEVFRNWLRSTIETMQKNRLSSLKDSKTNSNKIGQPLFRKLIPKCANLACPVVFCWRDGGKFFRFRSIPSVGNSRTESQNDSGPHKVRHYWLCEDCSRLFTLVYKEGSGVVLEFHSPAADSHSINPVSGVTLPETVISVRSTSRE
jgi:hypothetical protein